MQPTVSPSILFGTSDYGVSTGLLYGCERLHLHKSP